MKTSIPSVFITFALVCFGLFPRAQAVVPPPDGGYPNFTTAEGQNALFSLTTGAANTAVGWRSLFSNSTGQFNTATGAGALLLNNGDPTKEEASENSAFGAGALLSNTTGIRNTANGAFALFSNTTGFGNTANGSSALYSNTIGSVNTATGFGALLFNTMGSANTATGRDALYSNTIGTNNTAFGLAALALNTTGSNNAALGFNAATGVTTANNVIAIGTAGANVSDSCYIGNIWNQPGGSQAVYVNAEGKLGAQVSSGRFKDEIKPMEKASEVIYSLKPVSFRYKAEIEPTRARSFGLIAEEVEKANPDLVVRDKDGKAYSVRYDQVNAMLLNEFLKEHRKVEEQEAAISRLNATVARQEATGAEQQKQIEALTAGLQKVSAQIELNNSASQAVVKNR
jgi:uncharacterized coiled-coil protein SlyX